MSVKQRNYVNRQKQKVKRWGVEFTYKWADGTKLRVREFSPIDTRRGAEEYERDLMQSCQAGTHRQPKGQLRFRRSAARAQNVARNPSCSMRG